MKKTTTKQFREYVLNKFPALQERRAYRRLFQYLCFSCYFDKQTGELMIPHYVLEDMAGDVEYWKDKKGIFRSHLFLEQFKKDILPNFEWYDYAIQADNSWKGKPRMVKRFGLDAELEEMIQQEILNLELDNLVYFVNGRNYNQDSRALEIAAEKATRDLTPPSLNSAQRVIADYMNAVNPKGLMVKFNANQDAVLAAIEKIDNQRSKMTQYKILHAIRENPAIHYQPSKNGRTARLFHSSECAVGLKKSVRQALCAGWFEVDLVSSQLAILAQIINAPLTLALLDSGKDIWTYMSEQIFQTSVVDPNNKKAFKAIIYGSCFGRTKKEIKNELTSLGFSDFDLFFGNPIIDELFTRRREWFRRIEQYGFVTDAWGDKIEVTKDRWLGAVAATKIQSIELDIISAIFPVAERYKNICAIHLFQHDGATISIMDRNKVEKIKTEMNNAIQQQAMKFNVKTKLDVVLLENQ